MRRANPPRLLDFAGEMFRARTGHAFKPAPHQAVLCDALERVVSGECKRLVVNVPPRSGKTELAVVNFIAWCMGRWPDAEFIHASYSAELATQNAAEVRGVMQHERFAQYFGAPAFDRSTSAKDHFRTLAGGRVYATGAGGTITGFGAGKMRPGFGGAIVLDDPHKAAEAQSKTMRDAVIAWFKNTIESRKNSPDTTIIVIMQRLHVDDLAGYLLRGENGEHWEHVCIPAVGADGVSFWPEQFPHEDLARLESSSSFVYASQYQQVPKIMGGNIVKGEWFPRYAMPPKILHRSIYADTASKTKTANDSTVFECWGLGEDGRIYLLDLMRGKWEAMELENRAVAFWAKQAAEPVAELGALRYLKVEDASSGTGLIQTLRTKARAPVAAIKHSRDKYSRLYDVLGYLESGRVCIPADAPWVHDFVAECEAFTADDTHAHDDQVDPMIDAIVDMLATPAPCAPARRRVA
jgi:predicted phage terminase large subunit-like protein